MNKVLIKIMQINKISPINLINRLLHNRIKHIKQIRDQLLIKIDILCNHKWDNQYNLNNQLMKNITVVLIARDSIKWKCCLQTIVVTIIVENVQINTLVIFFKCIAKTLRVSNKLK